LEKKKKKTCKTQKNGEITEKNVGKKRKINKKIRKKDNTKKQK
jgi:hypothetical protein